MKLFVRRLSSWLLAGGLLLLLGGSFSLVSILTPVWASAKMAAADLSVAPTPTKTPFQPQHPTRTPFQPQKPTPTPASSPALADSSEQDQTGATPSPAPAEPPPAAPTPHFASRFLDYPAEKIRLRVFTVPGINGGNSIKMTFYPARDCPFGTGKSCVSRHRGGQVILLTIHSGIGGEGEPFRRAIEGTGLDQAGFSIAQIRSNIAALQNVLVQMSLGSDDLGELELAALARISPKDYQHYFDLPFDDALEMVAGADETVRSVLDSGEPLLVFEICGWHVAGEAWGKGTTPTSASIYLGFVRLRYS